jgi:hypothetical protein
MKYLLLVAAMGVASYEAPNAGPYDSLKECTDAGIEWIKSLPLEVGKKQGLIVRCKPVERSDDTYVR